MIFSYTINFKIFKTSLVLLSPAQIHCRRLYVLFLLLKLFPKGNISIYGGNRSPYILVGTDSHTGTSFKATE